MHSDPASQTTRRIPAPPADSRQAVTVFELEVPETSVPVLVVVRHAGQGELAGCVPGWEDLVPDEIPATEPEVVA